MCYSKLLFISTSMLSLSAFVFAADVPGNRAPEKPSIMFVRYGAKSVLVHYNREEPVSEFIKDLKKQANIPDATNVKLILAGKVLDEDSLSGSHHFEQYATLHAIVPKPSLEKSEEKKEVIAAKPSVETLTWYQAKSKSAYFKEKYKKLEPLVGFVSSDYDGYIAFKESPLYGYLLDTINKMGKEKPYVVIDDMLKNIASGISEDYQLFAKLVQPATVRAIAALQKLSGTGKRAGFQFDEYDPSPLSKYPSIIDPFLMKFTLKNGAEVEMTIYRFLHSVIGELDVVPVVKNSPLYNVLDTFDKSLTEIIKQ